MLSTHSGRSPRILSSDQWGGYLIYKLYPRTLVFADGRFDYYGEDLGNEHLCLMSGCGRWREIMEKWRFDLALLPKEWPLIELLKSSAQWQVVDHDQTGTLLGRVPVEK